MRDAEVRKLVDRGRAIKDQQDELDVELNKIKEVLRAEAKSRKVGYLLGNEKFCRVGPQTVTDCDARELEDTLVDLNRHAEFYDCIKVLVTEAKSRLGETLFNSISSTNSEPYKKVSFLAKIPKKYLT